MPTDPTYVVICTDRNEAREYLKASGFDAERMVLLSNRADGIMLRGNWYNPPIDKSFLVEPLPSPADTRYLEVLLNLSRHKNRIPHCGVCGDPIAHDLSVPDGQDLCNPCKKAQNALA